MNAKVYKTCAVPQCHNTSIKTNKLFVYVPHNKTRRNNWLNLAQRDTKSVCQNSPIYFCEDHFDLPNDMDNFMEYHVMGFVSQVRMKLGCVPTKFDCQSDKRRHTCTDHQTLNTKKQKKSIVISCGEDLGTKRETTSHLVFGETSPGSSVWQGSIDNITEEVTAKSIQVHQCECKSEILKHTILRIKNNPYFYIGIPENCYYLIKFIEDTLNIPAVFTLMCLKKIRLNNQFMELADDFAMTPTYAKELFMKNISLIARIMSPYIVKLNKDTVKYNLPIAFRNKFQYVSCIIDCIEIEIEEMSRPLFQSLSWSDYRKTNTIKYLVSCTPNGLVNYVSQGFGGRISDKYLLESCDFVKSLHPGVCILANRGFKHVDQYLRNQRVKLVRPQCNTIEVKTKANDTKQIAILRTHIERVFQQLREFTMLNPHACISHDLVHLLDSVIIIACGLINLQDTNM